MVQLFFNLVGSIRPRQALKNLSLLAPLVFSGNLFVASKFLIAWQCVFFFTLMTAAVYLINDIVDLKRDQLHPLKKKRPLAAGKLSRSTALLAALILLFSGLFLSYQHDFFYFLAALAYLGLQLGYIFLFKNYLLFDVLAIAAGYILRVYAGALAINVHLNVWFLLCVVSLALFMAIGKRRAELTLLAKQTTLQQRKTLTLYTPELLDAYLAMFANSTWLAYALFTFFAPVPLIKQRLPFLKELPLTLAGTSKWLMLTVPIVIYGLMRYMYLILKGTQAEAPEKVLLADKPILTAVSLWGIMVILILYGVG